MRLEEITASMRLTGVLPGESVMVIAATPTGADAVTLTCQDSRGQLLQLVIPRTQEERLAVVHEQGRSFSADPALFRLAAEAQRIRMAGAWDPMLAVSTSAIEPLPHQITAVYGELLPRVPLRFLLADDPGAGKTIMAGLYVKELILREDVQRCLVVAPGGLVEQWQDELQLRFGMHFEILGRDLAESAAGQAVLEHHPRLIARMDQLARNDDWLQLVRDSEWDLVVIDEAHRLSARWWGGEVKKSRRYELGELLAARTRHLLLMSATPHAGKDDDFRLLLGLLDPDRYAGRGGRLVDTDGVMRRMVKEDLLTFDGRRLFPERIAETVPYRLSDDEQVLYEHVSDYVRTEMNRADQLDDKRRRTVGFALTVLQRRLASSPEAIYQSLRRRAERLRRRRADLAAGRVPVDDVVAPDAADDDEYAAEEWERLEEQISDSATTARTVAELDAELVVLDELVVEARAVRASGTDRKWTELARIFTEEGLDLVHGRKLIIFTEHRDTLDYLVARIRTLLGSVDAVEAIHGGVSRPERRRITEEFTKNPACRILVATDAAGEGLNLQAAHLVMNYDLPWNPNRIEQRFGRVHRIGQREVCRLWNLVAEGTREGDVFTTLLTKIEAQRQAYGGKVFDVLGERFTEVPLSQLLLEAIRHGDDPAVRARMEQVIERAGDEIAELLEREALATDALPQSDVDALRQAMDEARARRLQPHFVQWAFTGGFEALGGRLVRRETGRFEIRHVPPVLRQGSPRSGTPVVRAYERVAFDLAYADAEPRADLLAPGHPLHDAVMTEVGRRWGAALTDGAVFVSEEVDAPHLLVGLVHEVRDATGETLERSLDHVLVAADGQVREAGLAPYLGWDAATDDVDVDAAWCVEAERRAVEWSAGESGVARLAALQERRGAELERQRAAVTKRLNRAANVLGAEAIKAQQKERLGEKPRDSSATLLRRADEMQARLDARLALIDRQSQLYAAPPRVVMTALVVPPAGHDAEAAARARETKRVARRAVDAVLAAERALGRTPVEQAINNKGFDILSHPDGDGPIWIEVKGRIDGGDTFEITVPEVLLGKNAAPRYRLALVRVDRDDPARDEVVYLDDPFAGIDFGSFHATRVQGDWAKMWAEGRPPF